MQRFLRLAVAVGLGMVLVHQYPEIRRYLKLSRM
jgi:hypothetical protein